MSEHLETPNYPFTAVHIILQSNQAIHRRASVWLVKVTFCTSNKMPSWTAFCRTPSAKLIFVLPASTKVFNLFGIDFTLPMRLEAKSKNTNTLPKGVTSKGYSLPWNTAVFGSFPVRPQSAAPMLFKWRQLSNGAKNSDTEASMANPLTSKVVILGKGHLCPATKSILVLVPVNFKISSFSSTESTRKIPVTSVSLRSTSKIWGQLARTATSPAIVVLERCTQRSSVPFNAPRFPVTLLFDRSRKKILASAKAARFPVTAVLRRMRCQILVQLAKTAKSPEILVSPKSSPLKPLSSLKLWLNVPLRSLRPLKRIFRTLQDVYLNRRQQLSFKSKHRRKRDFFRTQHLQHLRTWHASIVKLPSFPAERICCGYKRLNSIYLKCAYKTWPELQKFMYVYMHYICLIYTTFDSVISELPRYQSTPSTSLMSVSSASLSPSSKSTVRKAASSGHLLFLCAATSRATWCSMMAEEPLPPKPASTTSFRCKDGRSARPHHGCWFDPQIGQQQYGIQMDLKWFESVVKMMKILAF